MAKVLLEVLREHSPVPTTSPSISTTTHVPPIFEIILPMTTSAVELNRVWHYYREFVSGRLTGRWSRAMFTVGNGSVTSLPAKIRMIPLIEDKPSMLRHMRSWRRMCGTSRRLPAVFFGAQRPRR